MTRYVVTRDGFKCEYPICFWDIDLEDKMRYNDLGIWRATDDKGIAEMDMTYPEFQKLYGGLFLSPGDKRVIIEEYKWEDEDEDGDFDTHGVRWYLNAGGDICSSGK